MKDSRHPSSKNYQELNANVHNFQVRSISVGECAPRVRWAGVQNVETLENGRLKTVDLLLDIFYSGGFRLAVDAAILLGKTACFDVQVERLSGRARVRFTRDPYTHWSLAFLSPPQLELGARPLRGRLSALIRAHARRALQRKHTLPNYTIRYKPFFTKSDPSQLESQPEERVPVSPEGTLEISLLEMTRLFTVLWTGTKLERRQVYCTISLDSSQWICYRDKGKNLVFTLDIVVHKDHSQQLGASFRQDGSVVVVDTVVPLSAAYRADLRRDDVVLAANGKLVSNPGHIAKAVKGVSQTCFTVRVERRTKNEDKIEEDEGISEMNERQRRRESERVDVQLRKRRCSVENKSSSDSSDGSTPNASRPGTPSKHKDSKMNKTVEEEKKTGEKSEERRRQRLLRSHATSSFPLAETIIAGEKMNFELDKNHRFINLNVWGKNEEDGVDDVLLAYCNVPLLSVLRECNASKSGSFKKVLTLLPPDVDVAASKLHPLSGHSGFEPCLCYGDALLCFSSATQLRTPAEEPEEVDSVEVEVEDDARSTKEDEVVPKKAHRFTRTHFDRSTQCDYCGKKIWLKDAAQCSTCSMRCHKKCVTKCLSSESCDPSSKSADDPRVPEFLMTDHCDEQDSKAEDTSLGRNTLTGLLGGLRRAGSAHCLSPSSLAAPANRSLPPSPHHSPRCQSPDEEAAWSNLGLAMAEGVTSPLELLRPLIAAKLPTDLLLSGARDSGPMLLSNLPDRERADKISRLISEVKSALSRETEALSEAQCKILDKNLADEQLAERKRSFADCEERSQALTALLLHCCSAMQSIETGRDARDE